VQKIPVANSIDSKQPIYRKPVQCHVVHDGQNAVGCDQALVDCRTITGRRGRIRRAQGGMTSRTYANLNLRHLMTTDAALVFVSAASATKERRFSSQALVLLWHALQLMERQSKLKPARWNAKQSREE
jgi:hypothetical protein